jgi:hypothetical protein
MEKQMAEDKDPWIGETFLDLDGRSNERRIRILGFKDDPKTKADEGGLKFWPKVITTFAWLPKPKYRYEVIANAGDPRTVGRKGTISRHTLEYRYVKVSH